MTRSELQDKVITPTLDDVEVLFASKGEEYAITSAFHNFEKAIEMSRTAKTPIQTLEGMMLKHQVSIRDILNDADKYYLAIQSDAKDVRAENVDLMHSRAKIDEKFNDLITYTILLKGLVYAIYEHDKQLKDADTATEK